MRIENIESFLVRIPLAAEEHLKTWRGGRRLDDADPDGWVHTAARRRIRIRERDS